MKRILYISGMVILIAGTIFLPAFTDREHQAKYYSGFYIEILNASDEDMITLDEIRDLIDRNFGEIEGTPVNAINLAELEDVVLRNPYVSACEVYQTIDGGLFMKALVRKPLVRIINEDLQQYYLDHNGFVMPISRAHPSHVPIANGHISDRYVSIDKSERPLSSFSDTSILQQIYPVAWYLARDEFLSAFIDQIYINEHKEIELVPKIGSQQIILGSSEDAQEKLENLKTFYRKVMNKMDWEVYKTISLKYKNQIVCSK
jgi:cell division protein FtsQ